ncbi:unnamed protein product [Cylicocyclus nassatus]|uniref:SCP domain-containing protein n=1 Tax=Cylicocyclus nassatus TaxID=53992 RepID=A0AA36GDF6_CYLNA|nr:unnamed protein product [Cylicocyclus nassatus]
MEGKVQAELDKNLTRITFDNGYGQNVARFTRTNRSNDILHALELWSSPVLYYGIKNEVNRYEDDRLYTFANMIYAKTLRFGCGCKNESEMVIISCIYNLIGGYSKNILYEKGEKCKKAKDCTTYPASKCEKATGLCKYPGPPPKPDEGENTKCRGNKGVTDRLREKAVEAHNIRRSYLALGQVQNGPDSRKLPTASYMPRMIYDCEVELGAIQHVNKCTLTKSSEGERSGLGENVFVYPIPNMDSVTAIEAAIESWWSQCLYESIRTDLKFVADFKNKVIDQTGFTQMAWGKSVKLGCAVRTCHTSTFVVCRYSPAGNILNENIYSGGQVCGGCVAACNRTEGLCNIY